MLPISSQCIIHSIIVQKVTSEEAAKDIAAFIVTFFETFPRFKGREFHLSGESFAVRIF